MIAKISNEQLAEQEQHLTAALEHLEAECLRGWRDLNVKRWDEIMEHTSWAAVEAWDALDEVQLERKRRIAGTREA